MRLPTVDRSQTTRRVLTAGLILAMLVVLMAGAERVSAEGPVVAQKPIDVEAIAPESPAGSNGGIYAIVFGVPYSGTDGGAEWKEQAAALAPPLSIASLATDSGNAQVIYLGTYHDSLFRSDDGGMTFLRSSGGLGGGPQEAVTALLVSARHPGLVMAATASWTGTNRQNLVPQGLYLSTDWGLTWFRVSDPVGETTIASLALDSDLVVTVRSADGSARRMALETALSELKRHGAAQAQGSTGLAPLGSHTDQVGRDRRFWTGQDTPATPAHLAFSETPAAIRTLVSALADPKETLRRHTAMQTLEYLGEKAVPALMIALSADNPTLRGNAAEMLGWIASASSKPALMGAMGDEDRSVRLAAAWALSQIR